MKNEPAGKRPAGGWLGPRPVPEGQRRGRDISGSRPAVEVYGWQVREKPLSIKIPIDIVERLQDDIQYGLGMRTPCDVMGLLIGRVVKEYSATITIHDYVLAGYTSESVGSRLWSDERLADMIKPWSRPNSATYVVGFFRSQSEDWPEIAKEDLKGAKKLLKRTPNVFLLIRSGLSRSYAGRLFLRPSWRGKLDDEYGEFPLNADILRSQWDATAPKREGPSLHFVPGNPLQGKHRPEPPRYIQDAVDAVFEPVLPSNEEVLAEASIESVAVPMVEMLLQDILEEPEVEKRSLWSKLFRRTTEPAEAMQPEIAIELPAEPATQSLWAKLFHRAAEPAEAMQPEIAIELPAEPATQSLWAKLFHRTTEDVAPVVVEPAAAMQSETAIELPAEPSRQSLWAKLFHRTTEDVAPVVAEPAAAMQSETAIELPTEPAKQSLWATLFHQTTEDVAPVVAEPAAAMQSEPAIELPAEPAKQSLWAMLFHQTTEDVAPVVAEPAAAMQAETAIELPAEPSKQSLWAKLFHRTTEDVAPIVAETAIELPAEPSKQSLWAKPFHRTTEDVAPVVAEPATAMQSETAIELPTEPVKQSLWAKLFHRTTEDAAPVVAEPAAAIQEAPSAEPPNQGLWAKLFHRAPESAAPAEPIAINSAWYMQEAPSVEPAAPESALEAPESSPDPAQLSLWSKLFRPAEEEAEPISLSEPMDTPWADADEVMATEEAWEEPEPAKPSRWAKLFRRGADESPDLEAVPSNDEWDTPWTDSTEATPSEISAGYPEEFESDGEAEPDKPGLWARLFRPTREHPTPAEPDRQAEGESIEEQPLQAAAFGGNPPPPPGRHSWLAVAATWIVAVGLTMWLMSARGPLSQRRPEASETRPAVVANPIGLQVDSAGGLLEIAWDPISVAAMTSSGGFLTIRDGNMLKEVHLDSGEIRSGHLYYGPRNPDLGIRLEVARDDGATASESIRVVGPPPKGRPSDR